MKRSTWVALAVVGAAFVISAVAYPVLPDPTPIHWDTRGVADGFMAKPLGPFLLPLIMVPLAAVPGRAGRHVRIAVLACLLVLHAGTTLLTLGYPLSLAALVLVAVGGLLVVAGNALGKVQRNPFVGLRTPWTLLDDEVWLRSNRFAGRVLVVGGAALVIGGLLGAPWWLLLVVAAPVVVAPVVHSYVTWRRVRAEDHSQPT